MHLTNHQLAAGQTDDATRCRPFLLFQEAALCLQVTRALCMQDRQTVVMPGRTASAPLVKLVIKRVLDFSSQTLRSGAVVESSEAPKGSALLFLRGAPAVIRSLVRSSSVPRDFDQVTTWRLMLLA